MPKIVLKVVATAALIVATLHGVAFAQPIRPPERYRRPPALPVVVTYLPPEAVDHECRKAGSWERGTILACTRGPIQWLPDPCRYSGSYAQLVCHENAHTRGWPSDHPQE